MNKILLAAIIILLLGGGVYLFFQNYQPKNETNQSQPQAQKNIPMQIVSTAFAANQNIPVKYSCDGEGVNPPLEFKDVPTQSQALVLIVDDPDAPSGTWTHWTVWNIDPATSSIPENSVLPKAIQGQGSSGQNVYGALCPPAGQHRYFFKLYALDLKLTIPSFSTVDALTAAMAGHIIEQSELVGVYKRN